MSPQMHIDDLDDDDICPVCESECTCNRFNAPILSTSSTIVPSSLVPPAVQTNNVDALLPSKKPKLKIKLTIPSASQSKNLNASSSSSLSAVRPTKKKLKKTTSMMSDDASDGGNLLHLATHSLQHTPISAPKKRGRPPKHLPAARAVVKHQKASSSANRYDADTDPVVYNLPRSKPPSRKRAAATSRVAKSTNPKKTPKVSPRKFTKAPSPTVPVYESSELSDLDDSDSDTQSIRFPTFISACSSASSDSSDSDWLSSDSNMSRGSERDSARRKKTHMGGYDDHSPAHKWERHNKWEIRPRKKSVGAEGSSDGDASGASDGTDETEEEKQDEEAEADADAEPDEDEEDVEGPGVRRLMRYAGVSTGWTDDDDSIDDAELFFANLSDSSDDAVQDANLGSQPEIDYTGEAELDEDEVMEEVYETDILGFDLGLGESLFAVSEVASEFKRERSGSLLFGSTLGAAFDLQTIPEGIALQELENADVIMATSEEEEAVAALESETAINSNTQSASDFELHEEDDVFATSDGGSTTEDDYIDVDGIATPRNLVGSLRAVDPMRTMSPQVNRTFTYPRLDKVPRPADILAGKAFLSNESDNQLLFSGTKEGKDGETPRKRVPTMGSFVSQPTDCMKKLVISSPTGNPPPSPFPTIRRNRQRSLSTGLRSRSNSDVTSCHSRTSSLLGSTFSPYQSLILTDDFATDSPDLPLVDPMDLTDVIVPSVLEHDSDHSKDEPGTGDAKHDGVGESEDDISRHIQNLQRWDRIPMDTFRRTQMAINIGGDIVDVKDNVNWPVPGARRPHRPADGFSYGSSAGGLLKASPFSSGTLWEGGGAGSASSSPTSDRGRARGRKGQRANRAVVISPVLRPVGDGDHVDKFNLPSNIFQSSREKGGGSDSNRKNQQNALAHALSLKSRKELRREKRFNKGSVGPSSSFHLNRHHHFPNSKSRSTSSMQRMNFSGSSSLSPSI